MLNCRCHSPPEISYTLGAVPVTVYQCGTRLEGDVWHRSDRCARLEALAIVLRHNQPGVNMGCHALAGKLVGVLETEER